MTTIPDSLPVLSEAGALIELFVAGFQSAGTRSNYRTNLRGYPSVPSAELPASQMTLQTHTRAPQAPWAVSGSRFPG
jgi:hypothetical protein